VKKEAGETLEFKTKGLAKDFVLRPQYRVMDERFSVYWQKEA